MEYRWMSELTPVTNAAIVIERGSMRSPTLTLQPARGEPVEPRLVDDPSARCPRGTSAMKTMTVTTKLSATIAVASQPAAGLPSRLPKSASSGKSR